MVHLTEREDAAVGSWDAPLLPFMRVHASRQPHCTDIADEVVQQFDQVVLLMVGYVIRACTALEACSVALGAVTV